MIDPKRIKIIIERITTLWEECPDQRFFQFMDNLNARVCRVLDRPVLFNLYNLEDDEVLKALDELTKE